MHTKLWFLGFAVVLSVLAGGARAELNVGNFSFESPDFPPTNWLYYSQMSPQQQAETIWAPNPGNFAITEINSAWGGPTAFHGTQFMSMQAIVTVEQVISGFEPGKKYTVVWAEADRPGLGGNDFEVLIDTTQIEPPHTAASTDWEQRVSTSSFTATSTTHTLKFNALRSNTGDRSVFIDDVHVLLEGEEINRPPIANVPDQQVEFSAPSIKVSLPGPGGEVSDDGNPPEPNELNITWSIIGSPAGSNPTWENGNNDIPDPNLIIDQKGVYQVLVVADDEDKEANDTALIMVFPQGYTGLAAHWKLDDGIDVGPTTQIAADSSGSQDPNLISWDFDLVKHDGEVMGVIEAGEPNWTSGVDSPFTSQDFKGALWFDGVDDYVEIPSADGLNVTSDFTIAAWIYPHDLTRFQGIITKVTDGDHKQFALSFGEHDPKDALQLDYESGSNNYQLRGGQLIANQWQHVALTVDSDLLVTLYINSSQVAQETAPAEVIAQVDNINIGRWGGTYASYPRYFDGKIDDVRIYGVAKTAAEIIDLAGIDNGPPTADAGSDQRLIKSLDGNSLVLSGASVDDIPITGNYTATWAVLDGPLGPDAGITFTLPGGNDPEDQLATMDYPDVYGLYHLQLTATDADPELPTSSDDMYLIYQAEAQYSTDKDSPLAFYKLDEPVDDPNAIDSSGNAFHGPLVGDPNKPEWQPAGGKIDGALKFVNSGDDDNQYVDLRNVPGTNDLTVMLWVKPDVQGQHQYIIDKLPQSGTVGWAFRLDSNGTTVRLQVGSNDDALDIVGAYTANPWVHLAATFDVSTGQGKVFVNGLRVDTQTDAAYSVNGDSIISIPLHLGKPSSTDVEDELRNGMVDQVRLYDIALSELDIALLAVADDVVMEDCILSIEGMQMDSDLDGNCYTDVRDLKIMLGNWLKCKDLNNPSCW